MYIHINVGNHEPRWSGLRGQVLTKKQIVTDFEMDLDLHGGFLGVFNKEDKSCFLQRAGSKKAIFQVETTVIRLVCKIQATIWYFQWNYHT